MEKYFVNKNAQADGYHEVHTSECDWCPPLGHRIYLGEFAYCGLAIIVAKTYYAKSAECPHCCEMCQVT